MGSLMAGWDSPAPDPKAVYYRRNRSFTKGEIEAYWKSKKRIEEEHLRAISSLQENNQVNKFEGTDAGIRRSTSLPLTERTQRIVASDPMIDLEELRKTNAWWTRSNWAFLNETPVTAMDGPSYRYASQYHVTGLGHQISNDS